MILHNELIYMVLSCFTRDGVASWSGKGCIPPAPSPSGFRGHQSVHFPPKTRHFRTETVHKPYIPVQFPYKLRTPQSGREAAHAYEKPGTGTGLADGTDTGRFRRHQKPSIFGQKSTKCRPNLVENTPNGAKNTHEYGSTTGKSEQTPVKGSLIGVNSNKNRAGFDVTSRPASCLLTLVITWGAVLVTPVISWNAMPGTDVNRRCFPSPGAGSSAASFIASSMLSARREVGKGLRSVYPPCVDRSRRLCRSPPSASASAGPPLLIRSPMGTAEATPPALGGVSAFQPAPNRRGARSDPGPLHQADGAGGPVIADATTWQTPSGPAPPPAPASQPAWG